MRLIDADFEKDHYESMLLNPTPDVTQEDKRKAQIVINALKMAKTVDAEPVIRCCDCKHSWESLVPESVTCEEMQRTVYAQGYCYMGERKQDGDTE